MFLSYTEQNEHKSEGVENLLKLNIRVTSGGF